jgi:hypothetical protein
VARLAPSSRTHARRRLRRRRRRRDPVVGRPRSRFNRSWSVVLDKGRV